MTQCHSVPPHQDHQPSRSRRWSTSRALCLTESAQLVAVTGPWLASAVSFAQNRANASSEVCHAPPMRIASRRTPRRPGVRHRCTVETWTGRSRRRHGSPRANFVKVTRVSDVGSIMHTRADTSRSSRPRVSVLDKSHQPPIAVRTHSHYFAETRVRSRETDLFCISHASCRLR